jgi:hypothetical protein
MMKAEHSLVFLISRLARGCHFAGNVDSHRRLKMKMQAPVGEVKHAEKLQGHSATP